MDKNIPIKGRVWKLESAIDFINENLKGIRHELLILFDEIDQIKKNQERGNNDNSRSR